jgi:uncharacterized membrane protein YagU involved in acid resistance
MIFDDIIVVLHCMFKTLNVIIFQIENILCEVVYCIICTIWSKIYFGVHKATHYLGIWICIHDSSHSWIFGESYLFSQNFNCMGGLSELQLNM